MCKITINEEKNGIEVRFESKPDTSVLEALKENGFRWSGKQKMWYAKHSEERVQFVQSIGSVSINNNAEKDRSENEYNLFALTRVDLIPNNVNKSLSTKEIAALIRDHMKTRFPMCKISVRVHGYDSIWIKIVSSPFAKDSEELQAIAKYFEAYAESYNYCTCYDPYGDYGSSYNFYGAHNPIEYDYVQTEMTVHHMGLAERFQKDKTAFEAEEEKRREEEYAKHQKEMEEERERNRIAENQRKIAHDRVEANVMVKDIPDSEQYFIENLLDSSISKQDSVDEYTENNAEKDVKRCVCKVCREVTMSAEIYAIFSNQLMDDWSFVAGLGGSRCDDLRINSIVDYEQMGKEERETVEWYSYDCISVFCGDKLMMVVDPQGYSYCRYVYLSDETTTKLAEHHTNQVLTQEEHDLYLSKAEELYEESAEIIIRNNWEGSGNWNVEHFADYKQAMIKWIDEHNFPFNVNVVRAIPEHMSVEFKSAMYRVLTEVDGIQHQFMRAGLEQGQRITMVRISDLGGVSLTRATFDSFECGKYAQYDNAVKLILRPERKKHLHYIWLYREVLIYDGWLDDIPENLLFDVEVKPNMTIKRSKYLSFDHTQYDVVMNYLKDKGARLLVNTYKPTFGGKMEG